MGRRIATVFGGSGFLGRHIVKRLVAKGYTVVVAVRDVDAGKFLKPFGEPGQIILKACNVRKLEMVEEAVVGAEAVYNLVGILSPWGKQTFGAVHTEGAENIAKACAKAKVDHLVHISAIGADAEAEANYARTKGEGEKVVLDAFPTAVILRPSVVFGPEDGFFNKFAGMTRYSPALPIMGAPLLPKVSFKGGKLDINLYGDGGAKMQPVYVGDVAEASVKVLEMKEAKGQVYELGGPEVMSFMGIMKRVLKHTGRKCFFAPMALSVGKIMGSLMGVLPNPMLTRDQVKMLETDNVVGEDALGFKELGIEPTLADSVLPNYLSRFKAQRDQPLHVERRAQ